MKILKPKNSEKYTGIVEWENGTKYWYKDGLLHREDGPAVEWADGAKFWYKEGKLHRIDGPAIEYANGSKLWYEKGKLHRIDGSAVEWNDGIKEWWIEGKFYNQSDLEKFINYFLFLGKENGKYNLCWLKFLTEQRIEEFPIIPGMHNALWFRELFQNLDEIKTTPIT